MPMPRWRSARRRWPRPGSTIDYVALVDAETLARAGRRAGRAACSPRRGSGTTRLIDNIAGQTP